MTPVGALADQYWQGVMRRNPTLATFFGDFQYNDRLPDVGPAGRAAEQAALEELLRGLDAVAGSPAPPDGEDAITADMLRQAATAGLAAVRLRLDEMAVDQMEGPQVWLPELLNWHPTDTPRHVDELIARYRGFSAYMDAYLQNLADGVRDGRTAPRAAVERVVAQLRALLAAPAPESPLAALAGTLAPGPAAELVRAVADVVYPAYQRMLDYLADEYLERHAREQPGVWSVTDGGEIYAVLARQHTTTELTPAELHAIGRDDLAGIHAEMRAIMGRLGASSESIRGFTERLTHASENLPSTRAEIVQTAERLLAEAQAALPRAFGHLPRTPVVVKAIEEYRERDMVAAFYNQPAADNSRPGTFYVNTFEPASRPRHTLPALVFHESVPGHHLQIAVAQETAGLPAFRRMSAGFMANAFVEGWALYTERLSDELGLYPDDLARFGMLGYQAWRACRLVVDTGLHALRWSRDQAIQFFFENVGLTERETVNEVDRYIIWPGQALAYKVGQREIERLRQEAAARQGARFDLRAFHDEVLRHAAVPLSTLERIVETAFPSEALGR